MKAVFSIVTRGTMSMSCSEAISSSSGGVTDVLSDCGRAMVSGLCLPSANRLAARREGRNADDRLQGLFFFQSRDQSLKISPS